VVHQIRNSLKFVSYKDRKEIAKDLKSVYQADTEDLAIQNLEYFNEKWGKRYPHIYDLWKRNWDELATFFKYPKELRKLIYTTNPIESLNSIIKRKQNLKAHSLQKKQLLKSFLLQHRRLCKNGKTVGLETGRKFILNL
ncbi:IS256 family transposase, partial [Lebetimonas sp. JS138]|uniref:IS256 family transposase n=1 Tax=Lebetimonas sp. JS138 TaxID=990072 RepID=UPI0004644112